MNIDPMYSLVIVICLTAILSFFSKEFSNLIKRIFEVKGMKTFLPIALASWFVFYFEDVTLWALYYMRDLLYQITGFYGYLLPKGKLFSDLLLITVLTVVSVLPSMILNILSYRKHHIPYKHSYLVCTIIWIISAILLIALPALYK